jgi:hypothetical protein
MLFFATSLFEWIGLRLSSRHERSVDQPCVCSEMKKAMHLSPVMIEGSGRQDLNIYFTTLKE